MAEKIYVASKVKHALFWRTLRSAGFPIISTWIDEAGEGESADYGELAARCIDEVLSSTRVVLYCEDGDILKGALIEVGAALAAGKPVYCVGHCDSVSRVFREHPRWTNVKSVHDAFPDTRPQEAPRA